MFVNVILILMFYCQYYVMVRMSFHLSFFFMLIFILSILNVYVIYLYLCHYYVNILIMVSHLYLIVIH